ncbi:MAG TPA: hypothetical protein VN538_02330 [Clostridia bacterium]|nr:hypothetical protein [Clostridia bacterium]
MPYDYKEIASNARAFHDVGMLLFSEPEKWPIAPYSSPFLVNIAFSCELYMKAIITYYNRNISKSELKDLGHRLDKLFNALPLQIQSEIITKIPDSMVKKQQIEQKKRYIAFLERNHNPQERKMLEHRISITVSTFREMLANNANIFDNWRYLFDENNGSIKSCDIWFLEKLSNELHNIMVGIMNLKS